MVKLAFTSTQKIHPDDLRNTMSKRQRPQHPTTAAAATTTTTTFAYSTQLSGDARPASPTRMHKDLMWHVLYDKDIELIRDITLPAAERAEAGSSGTSEIVEYVKLCKNLAAMRTLFFVILNIDEQLRADICSADFCRAVWTSHGSPSAVCPHKATRFFQDIETTAVHPWMRSEQCSAAEFVDIARVLYMCS